MQGVAVGQICLSPCHAQWGQSSLCAKASEQRWRVFTPGRRSEKCTRIWNRETVARKVETKEKGQCGHRGWNRAYKSIVLEPQRPANATRKPVLVKQANQSPAWLACRLAICHLTNRRHCAIRRRKDARRPRTSVMLQCASITVHDHCTHCAQYKHTTQQPTHHARILHHTQ
jgi:hypothetical protein